MSETGTTLSQKVAEKAGGWLAGKVSRRSFLGRTAVVGAALSVGPVGFILKPQSAYASVCGPGSSCGEGWTAMCCTIADGVNQCPPGSFAGGWWKADAAGLCGGTARYYIDCQGECTGCGCSGSNFCGEGCWNCQRHCASGTCDERRVCWNVFRYGQCNQQIGCSGPVLCRMISCVPPWHFEACTTDAATDDNTTDHGAPCLPSWSALQARYAALGGPGSVLGVGTGAEYAVTGGTAQDLAHGKLYAGSAGVHYVLAQVVGRYLAQGGPARWGLPTSDTVRSHDKVGLSNTFAGGAAVHYSPTTGAHLVAGQTLAKWQGYGAELSPYGYPVTEIGLAPGSTTQVQRFARGAFFTAHGAATHGLVGPVWVAYERHGFAALGIPTGDETATPDGKGRIARLSKGGAIFSGPTVGHLVSGSQLTHYDQLGGAGSVLGLPTSEAAPHGTGVVLQDFEHGQMWSSAAGTFEVHGPLSAAYARAGSKVLGVPTSDQTVVGTGVHNTFTHGVVASSPATGTHWVSDPIAASWVSQGGETGSLGFPTTDVTTAADGTQSCTFQGGTLRADANGTVSPG